MNRTSDGAVVLGAVIPGAAKDRVVSDAVTAGLGVAASLPDGRGAIEIRSAIDKLTAVEKVEELAARNVLAIVGPVGDSMTDAAAARAEGLGVPLISLSPHAEGRASGRFVFYIRHSRKHEPRRLQSADLAFGLSATLYWDRTAITARGQRVRLPPPSRRAAVRLSPRCCTRETRFRSQRSSAVLALVLRACSSRTRPLNWR